MDRLKFTQIKTFRAEQLTKQNSKCLLCNELIEDESEAVLDHSHKTGLVRGVLHRGCNAFLGNIENNMTRNKINSERLISILQNVSGYIHFINQGILHPTYKTADEKKERAKQKRRKKNVDVSSIYDCP